MKILFLTVDRSNVVTKHWGWIHNSLSKFANVDFIKLPLLGCKAGEFARKVSRREIIIDSIVNPVLNKKKYDFILTDANFAFENEPWDKIKIPRGMIIQDVHCVANPITDSNPYMQMEIAKKQHWDIIFHRFKTAIFEWFDDMIKEMNCKTIWMPHSIDLNVFNDYKLKKDIDVLMSGWHFPEIYPWRHKAHEILKDCSFYTEVQRPPESGKIDNTRWPVADDYSKLLNRSKICITGGLKFNYPILKYFEMAASNTCIMSNWFDELGDLGFVPEKNIIVMDFDNLKKQIKWWLEHDKEREEISKNAYELIISRHTSDIRAQEIIGEIQ